MCPSNTSYFSENYLLVIYQKPEGPHIFSSTRKATVTTRCLLNMSYCSENYVFVMFKFHFFKLIGASVLLLLNGNQILAAMAAILEKLQHPFFDRDFLLDGPSALSEFQINQCECSPVIERKPKLRWLPWRPYWKSCDTHFKQGSFPSWSQSTL